MRRVLAALLAALLLPACATVEAGLGEVTDRADAVVGTVRWCTAAARLANAVAQRDAVAAREAAQDLADQAPEELRGDVDVLLDAAERAVAGDIDVLRAPGVTAAADRLRTAISDRCDPRS